MIERFGIEPASEIGRRHLKDGLAQLFRLLPQGDGMHVHHAIDAFLGFLQLDPVQHGAQIIAEVQIARGLHAGENAWGESGHQGNPVDWSGRLMPANARA